jgi:hypothetical protein
MIHITVQYDAETRTFRLVDDAARVILEGDALYDLAIPLTVEEGKKGTTDDALTQLVSAARHTAYNSRN